MTRFQDKIALVTGGSRGIGLAVVKRLAAEGAEVVLVDLVIQEAAQALVAELVGQGRAVRAVQADVRDGARAQQIVEEIVEQRGRIDVLVNSAGIVRDGLMGAMTPDQWRDVLEVNLFGTYNYCRAAAQHLSYQRKGSVVNVSSTAAAFPSRGQVNYAASKGGVEGLTRAMAKEFAPRGVRVNAVAPGLIDTDLSKAVRGLIGDRVKDIIPMKRVGSPEEVANAIVFLASDEAAYVTGQVLRVDGGFGLGGY
jgi:3-oxoacyl-[acyl-carrier protein] reductase